ncbi:MAG: urease accessory UreF family protein [Pseudomonadota bacterium]
MTDASALLVALQHGDSAFPSGGFAFSWGLETLKADGLVRDAAGVVAFARSQLAFRWATSDRVFLRRAAQAPDDLEHLVALDQEVEALTLPAEMRAGSRRAGRSLLRAHAKLATPGVAAYQASVKSGDAYGHLPVAQAVAWSGAGLGLPEVETVAAFTLASGITQAAIRLAILGPLEAQALLADLREDITVLLDQPVPDLPHAFTPAAEIAVMRHETGDARLFAT